MVINNLHFAELPSCTFVPFVVDEFRPPPQSVTCSYATLAQPSVCGSRYGILANLTTSASVRLAGLTKTGRIFYPPGMQRRKQHPLEYLARFFDTTEINTSFLWTAEARTRETLVP